jgi:hypothetical protein
LHYSKKLFESNILFVFYNTIIMTKGDVTYEILKIVMNDEFQNIWENLQIIELLLRKFSSIP